MYFDKTSFRLRAVWRSVFFILFLVEIPLCLIRRGVLSSLIRVYTVFPGLKLLNVKKVINVKTVINVKNISANCK